MASIVSTTTSSSTSPISNFVDYFNNVKPYHSKILEINQKYNFYDAFITYFSENSNYSFTYANTPLCSPVGFGYQFDDCCGYDALDCCNLGTCTTDAATFQNLSQILTLPIISVSAANGEVIVNGNYTFDQTYQIKSINSTNNLTVHGDLRPILGTQPIFNIIQKYTVPYTINSINTITISGNYTDALSVAEKLYIYGSKSNNGVYYIASSIYYSYNNTTQIIVYGSLTANDAGTILIYKATHNRGVYTVSNYVYNGSDTIITINKNINSLSLETSPTSLVFKTGLIENRIVNIQNNDNQNNGLWEINYSTFSNNQTTIYLKNALTHDTLSVGTISLMAHTDIQDYTNELSCMPPKEANLVANFSEVLLIKGGMLASPTPTPTSTVTPTLTPTSTVTPTVTPTPTVTATPSITVSTTPSITVSTTPSPTAVPSPTPTPTRSSTPPVTPTRTPDPSITPSPSPTYAPLGFYVKDGDPRSSVYMTNFGTPSTISIYCTAGNYNLGLYNGAQYSLDSSGNIVGCAANTNNVYTPTSRPPQYEDNNAKTNMPIIFPTGGSGNYTVTIENLAIQCQKQAYADGPGSVGLAMATSSNKTAINEYSGDALMSYNTGTAWSSGPAKELLYNSYYSGFGPFFGMVGCSAITDYQMEFVFTMIIKDNVTGHTLNVPGILAVDRAGTGSQGGYNPCG